MSIIKEKLEEFKTIIWVVLALLLIASGGGTYFFSLIYQPNLKAISKLEHHLAFVKQERQIWEEERQAKGVTEVEQTDFTARFNFLTRNEISEDRLIPMLLTRFQTWFNRKDLSFQNLTSLGTETVDSYQIKRIALSGRSTFSQFCRLLEWLEKDMLAVIDGFDLPPECYPAVWQTKKNKNDRIAGCRIRPFNIIFHWVENVPRRFRSIPVFPESVTIERDPFKPSRLEKIYDGRHPLPLDKIIYIPPPESIKLQGIIAGENGLQAMINNKFYGPGANMTDGYIVLSIESGEVIIGQKNIRHRLKLPRKMIKF
jgi:hypothetical protein